MTMNNELLLPRLELPFGDGVCVYAPAVKPQFADGAKHAPFTAEDIRSIFGNDNPLNVEIGIGNGEFLQHYATKCPDENWLGFEVFKKVVIKAEKRALRVPSRNARVVHFDASFIVPLLPEQSVKGIFVNFPDPWPKTRHQRRRLLKTDFINMLVDKLVIGGVLTMATDHADYAKEIKKNLEPVSRLKSLFDTICVNELVDYYETKYYRKFAVHVGVHFFRLERIA